MTQPRLLTPEDAIHLSGRIERASARWRPLVVGGLLLIVLGFVVLTFRLDHQRRAAVERADTQTSRLQSLESVLDNARLLTGRAVDRGERGENWVAMARLLNLATRQVDALNATIDAPASSPANVEIVDTATRKPGSAPTATVPGTAGAPLPLIRLYIQINDPNQRAAAEAVATSWSARQIAGATVVVPGVELVTGKGDNSVRCTRVDACRQVDAVTDWINNTLASPKLHKLDISGRYLNATKILPGTYEVWFGSGPIVPVPVDKA